jgi:hypothetical protein
MKTPVVDMDAFKVCTTLSEVHTAIIDSHLDRVRLSIGKQPTTPASSDDVDQSTEPPGDEC